MIEFMYHSLPTLRVRLAHWSFIKSSVPSPFHPHPILSVPIPSPSHPIRYSPQTFQTFHTCRTARLKGSKNETRVRVEVRLFSNYTPHHTAAVHHHRAAAHHHTEAVADTEAAAAGMVVAGRREVAADMEVAAGKAVAAEDRPDTPAAAAVGPGSILPPAGAGHTGLGKGPARRHRLAAGDYAARGKSRTRTGAEARPEQRRGCTAGT